MYPILAWANGIMDPTKVPAGTRLAVPVLVPYRLEKGESISSTSDRFYGDPKQFTVIASASGIDDPARVPAGSVLKVPCLLPRPTMRTALDTNKSKGTGSGTDKAMALLAQAEALFRAGKYGDAWKTGYEAVKGLEGKEKARALRLLASTQYAFGRMEEALEDLKAAYDLDTEFTPDPAYVNPEMMELYSKARRQ